MASNLINFICPFSGYSKVINSFIDPIIQHLPNHTYTITDKPSKSDHPRTNVHFFIENHSKNGPGSNIDILIPHGLADKNYRTPTALNKFDLVLVSGEAWREKLISRGVAAEKLMVAGYPKLDPVFQGMDKNISNNNQSPRAERKLRVLWAPTHNAIQEVSSYPAFLDCMDELTDILKKYGNIDFMCAPHPAIKKLAPVTLQDLMYADVVLSDSSSMIYEAMALNKPVILLSWLVKDGIYNKFPGTFEEQLYVESICYQANCFSDLIDWLTVKRGLLQFTPTMKSFIEGIFPERLRGCSGKAMADILKNLSIKK